MPLGRLHLARDEPTVAPELLDRLLANSDLPDYDEGRLRALAAECLVRMQRIDEAREHTT